MLKFLGVSRSGYRAFLLHKPSASQQRKNAIKHKIKSIYDDSKQNYGAPKITHELRKSGEIIAERTVGKYMKEINGSAHGHPLKGILTSVTSFITYLMNNLTQTVLTLSGALISLTY